MCAIKLVPLLYLFSFVLDSKPAPPLYQTKLAESHDSDIGSDINNLNDFEDTKMLNKLNYLENKIDKLTNIVSTTSVTGQMDTLGLLAQGQHSSRSAANAPIFHSRSQSLDRGLTGQSRISQGDYLASPQNYARNSILSTAADNPVNLGFGQGIMSEPNVDYKPPLPKLPIMTQNIAASINNSPFDKLDAELSARHKNLEHNIKSFREDNPWWFENNFTETENLSAKELIQRRVNLMISQQQESSRAVAGGLNQINLSARSRNNSTSLNSTAGNLMYKNVSVGNVTPKKGHSMPVVL